MELSYQAIKTANQAREADELRTETRRRNLLVLIYHYLMEEGYMDAASCLEQDTNFGLRRFEVCDNIDLDTILMEYESYYFIKFQKYPKLTKKLPEQGRSYMLSVKPVYILFWTQERLLKPISSFYWMDSEMRELAAVISRVSILHIIHRFIQIKCTGKTMLAKAVATECNTTFFNISASSIVSKWRGDSEKLVRVLFELARYHAPSTIFLDELESVMSQRGVGQGGEHEGSRRMKTELLVQMDGLARSKDLVFVLAASNLPWELDHAMLRRLEKRILVGLPSDPARKAMINHWLPPVSNNGGIELRTELAYDILAQETEGYSGSDIRLVCKEAAMRPVRKIFDALENHSEGHCDMSFIELETVTTADFLEVIAHTKPSARNLTDRFSAWEREYESV
uniref:Katanin p60 ATPase-containing subunit A-like 2 n=1 Tax=Astyanax mexicanus TaxID=7994 RepID=A0A8B9L270_ASTMX